MAEGNLPLLQMFIAVLFLLLMFIFAKGVFDARDYVHYKRRFNKDLRSHIKTMKWGTFITLFGVVLVEVFVRLAGGYQPDTLFWVHLGFAGPFLLFLLTLAFWKTGLRSPGLHRKLGYFCLTTFVGVLLTGGVLLFKY